MNDRIHYHNIPLSSFCLLYLVRNIENFNLIDFLLNYYERRETNEVTNTNKQEYTINANK